MPEGPEHKLLRQEAEFILQKYGGEPQTNSQDIDIFAFNKRMRVEIQIDARRDNLIKDLFDGANVIVVPRDRQRKIINLLRRIYAEKGRVLNIPVLNIYQFRMYVIRFARHRIKRRKSLQIISS